MDVTFATSMFPPLALGFFHLVTGALLRYLAYAVAVDFALGFHWRV